MLGSFLGVVNFEGIIQGINSTLYGGDASFFTNGPPTVEGVVAMPLLCGDYGISPLPLCGFWRERLNSCRLR